MTPVPDDFDLTTAIHDALEEERDARVVQTTGGGEGPRLIRAVLYAALAIMEAANLLVDVRVNPDFYRSR